MDSFLVLASGNPSSRSLVSSVVLLLRELFNEGPLQTLKFKHDQICKIAQLMLVACRETLTEINSLYADALQELCQVSLNCRLYIVLLVRELNE